MSSGPPCLCASGFLGQELLCSAECGLDKQHVAMQSRKGCLWLFHSILESKRVPRSLSAGQTSLLKQRGAYLNTEQRQIFGSPPNSNSRLTLHLLQALSQAQATRAAKEVQTRRWTFEIISCKCGQIPMPWLRRWTYVPQRRSISSDQR